MKKAITGNVKGRVQGVGFRYFVQMEAEKLDLCGYVRNVDDDSVEYFAQGEEADLNTFITKLKSGPPMARVDKLLNRETAINDKLRYFTITH
ncbi:MAG: acylphosphatase [Fibrobacteres bacterium]|nr:acylphosphatase [Fibrobacterota bacterium]